MDLKSTRKIIARDSEETCPVGLGISTCLFEDRSLSPSMLQRLNASGFGWIELFANRPHLDYHNRSLLKDIASWFKSETESAASLHLPFFVREGRSQVRWISALDRAKGDRMRALDEVKRALDIADYLTISHTVVHLGVPQQMFTPIDFEHAYQLIDTINNFTNAKILIENIPNGISTLERIHEFLQVAELQHVGICYDSGHGRFDGTLPSLDRVSAIHLSDNNGRNDDHLWPFEGVLNWPRFIAELLDSEYDGPMILEGPVGDLDAVQRTSSRLRELLNEARESLTDFRRNHALVRRDDENNLH